MTNVVAGSILEEDPYLPKVLLGYFSNFAFSAPCTGRWEKAFEKVPFVVHVSAHVSEFSWFSDLLLPAPDFMFERWGIQSASGNRYSQVSITMPLVTSLGNDIGDETGLRGCWRRPWPSVDMMPHCVISRSNSKIPKQGRALPLMPSWACLPPS